MDMIISSLAGMLPSEVTACKSFAESAVIIKSECTGAESAVIVKSECNGAESAVIVVVKSKCKNAGKCYVPNRKCAPAVGGSCGR